MILIMGLPGAGKSVQSQLIQDKLGLHWLSTGQLFRETNDQQIKSIMEKGELVSDELVCRMVGARLKHIGYDATFLLDGFPRTVEQARWLVEHADEIDKHIRFILFLTVSESVAAERLGDRGRDDDTDAALAKRNEESAKIRPALEYLKSHGIEVVEVDADGTVEEIFSEISDAITQRVEHVHQDKD